MKTHSRKDGLAAYLRSHVHPATIIVCEQPKFLYMKPPKTAGSSILRFDLEKRLPGIFHKQNQPEQFDEWINRITDEDLKDYFIFSVVRNPWDRFVSLAAYFQIPFKELVDNFDEYLENNKKVRTHSWPLNVYTHFNGEQFVDFYCRFECLQSDMNLVFDHLGLERRKLPFVNKSKHSHYSAYYTDKAKKLVESVYQKDIEYFGYMLESESDSSNSIVSRINRKIFGTIH